MKDKIIINPQNILNLISKMDSNYQVQLKISKGEIKDLLAEITDLLIINANMPETDELPN